MGVKLRGAAEGFVIVPVLYPFLLKHSWCCLGSSLKQIKCWIVFVIVVRFDIIQVTFWPCGDKTRPLSLEVKFLLFVPS